MIGDIPAYVKDTGPYTLLLNVNYDYTGYAALSVRIHDPAGNVETVTEGADVVAYDADDGLVSLKVDAARTDEEGRWRVVAVIDGKYSEPAGNYDVVLEAVNG